MGPRRRRARRRTGYDVLFLPKNGRPARQFGLSRAVIGFVLAAFVANLVLVVGLFSVSVSQRMELSMKSSMLRALERSLRTAEETNAEQARRLHDLSVEADRLTRRLRDVEQLTDEVWMLLGESPESLEGAEQQVVAGRGGPDVSSADVVEQTSVALGSLSNQVPLQLRELEQLRELVVARNHRLDHTPSVWPVDGYVSSEFGVRRHPISGRTQRHDGIDIAAHRGTPVHATAAGVVTFAGDRGGYGLTVIVDHGYGVQTLYAHNSRLHVRRGETVRRGDVVASVGTTGVSTGPHVHYEVIVNGKHVNPRTYLP